MQVVVAAVTLCNGLEGFRYSVPIAPWLIKLESEEYYPTAILIPLSLTEKVDELVLREDVELLSWKIRKRIPSFRSAMWSDKNKLVPRAPENKVTSNVGNQSSIEEQYVSVLFGYRSSSQAVQDIFVQCMTRELLPSPMYYLELGASEPVEISNTFILERDLSWRGLSVKIDENLGSSFNLSRSNMCLISDATQIDYKSEFKKLDFPELLG